MLLDKNKLKEDYIKVINNEIENLKQKYEDYMLNLLNAKINNITENYINARNLVNTIDTIEKLAKEIEKKGENKENE